jgi:hypothetical protein
MNVVFEEDNQYPSAAKDNFSPVSPGWLTNLLLRTGVVKTESGANAVLAAAAVVCIILAAVMYFSFGQASPSQAVPEDIINSPQPTRSL